MSEIFNPNYPAKFTQEDVENGHVNSDGTINFGSSGILIVKNTDGRFETLPDDDSEYCFIVSDALFDKMVKTFLSGGEVKVMSYFSSLEIGKVVQCPSEFRVIENDFCQVMEALDASIFNPDWGDESVMIISESTYERLMEE